MILSKYCQFDGGMNFSTPPIGPTVQQTHLSNNLMACVPFHSPSVAVPFKEEVAPYKEEVAPYKEEVTPYKEEVNQQISMPCLVPQNAVPDSKANYLFYGEAKPVAASGNVGGPIANVTNPIIPSPTITFYQMPDGSLIMGSPATVPPTPAATTILQSPLIDSSTNFIPNNTAVTAANNNNQVVLQFTAFPSVPIAASPAPIPQSNVLTMSPNQQTPSAVPQTFKSESGKVFLMDPSSRTTVPPPAVAAQNAKPRALAPKGGRLSSARPHHSTAAQVGTLITSRPPFLPGGFASNDANGLSFNKISALQLLIQHKLLTVPESAEEILQVKVQLQSQCFVLYLSRAQKTSLEYVLASLGVLEQRIFLNTFVEEQCRLYRSLKPSPAVESIQPPPPPPPPVSIPPCGVVYNTVNTTTSITTATTAATHPAPSNVFVPTTAVPTHSSLLSSSLSQSLPVKPAVTKTRTPKPTARLQAVMFCDQMRYVTAGRHMPSLLQSDNSWNNNMVAIEDARSTKDTIARLLSFHVIDDPDAAENESFIAAQTALDEYCNSIQHKAREVMQYASNLLERETWRCEMHSFEVESHFPMLAGVVDCERDQTPVTAKQRLYNT